MFKTNYRLFSVGILAAFSFCSTMALVGCTAGSIEEEPGEETASSEEAVSGSVGGCPFAPGQTYVGGQYASIIDCSKANLAGVKILGGTFVFAKFNGTDLTGASFAGSKFNARLDLVDANLTGADVSNVTFSVGGQPILLRTNLTSANLTGTKLLKGTLSKAILLNTICPNGQSSALYGNTCP